MTDRASSRRVTSWLAWACVGSVVACGGTTRTTRPLEASPIESPTTPMTPMTEGWLEGAWSGDGVTELWAREGSMLYGVSLSEHGMELLRFDGARLLAAPPGLAPVELVVRRRDATSVEVHRAGHDPEWIRYAVDGDTLVAEIGVGEHVGGHWRFDREPATGPFFGSVDATVSWRGDEVWLTVPPCLCAPRVRCVGVVLSEGSAADGVVEAEGLALFAAVLSAGCEACEAGETRCDVAPDVGSVVAATVTLGGAPLVRQVDGSFRGAGRMFATLR